MASNEELVDLATKIKKWRDVRAEYVRQCNGLHYNMGMVEAYNAVLYMLEQMGIEPRA